MSASSSNSFARLTRVWSVVSGSRTPPASGGLAAAVAAKERTLLANQSSDSCSWASDLE